MAKTIKVRVFVATWYDEDGVARYDAGGWNDSPPGRPDDSEMRGFISPPGGRDGRFTWITAEVPLPEEPGTVEAEVER